MTSEEVPCKDQDYIIVVRDNTLVAIGGWKKTSFKTEWKDLPPNARASPAVATHSTYIHLWIMTIYLHVHSQSGDDQLHGS